MNPQLRHALAAALLCLSAVSGGGCAKSIGDGCTANSDCSISADRVCDLSQTGGYCTVPGCEGGGCPDEAVCVLFDAHSTRLRRRYCMAGCNDDSDCREGYACRRPDAPVCSMNTTAVLPVGQTCNRIADTATKFAGWCVQAR